MTCQTTVRISDLIIPKYQPIFNDRRVRHIILTSGRAGTKSSFAAILADYRLVSDAHGSVVCLRKHHNKLRKTVYKEMLRGINRLRIPKKEFDITKSPMEIRYRRTGATIYFSGSDGIDDTKGIIDEDKPIKLVILDELTEFFEDGEGEDELQNIEATFIRGNTSGFQMVYLYNPPKNPNAPVNQWCRKMEMRPDCVHIHTDYRDVPQEWLGRDLVESAELMKALDEKQYNWVWLGISTGIDDLIYYMFSEEHRKEPEQTHFRMIGIGVDYGQQNATTFQAAGVDLGKRRLAGLGEYYHSGRESGRQKSPSDYAKELIQFTDQLHETYSCSVFYVFIDPSAAGLAEEIRRLAAQNRGYGISLKPAENEVGIGIQRIQKLLTYQLLTISEKQENLIREMGTYAYDPKSIEGGREKPMKVDDHCCDALRYLAMGLWPKLRHFLPAGERED